MPYKEYTVAMLAAYSGRPEASYPTPYTTASALPQATLLFKMGTCIADPSGLTAEEQQLVDFAILSMADAIVLSQPFQTVKASPFSSESIGSYSYSKAASAVRKGQDTGIEWFDMAVDMLSVCEGAGGDFAFGGVEVFEHAEGAYVRGSAGQNLRYLTPAEVTESRSYGYDPAPGYTPAPAVTGLYGGDFQGSVSADFDGGEF